MSLCMCGFSGVVVLMYVAPECYESSAQIFVVDGSVANWPSLRGQGGIDFVTCHGHNLRLWSLS